ncbi:MAG: hypothetical protein ACFCUP_01350 [Actinomycetales bacterium]
MERIGDGALLAGRYRLAEKVHADPVATLWRAQDVTLDRAAAVRVLAAGHSHVDATLDAARRAAIIDDHRLQRVLGVGVEAGCGYVILEWIEGPGGSELAGRVGEREARRIVREAAEAVEAARSRGLRHGRLTPGHIRRTADGRVRVLGLAVDAATIGLPYLAGPDSADPTDLVAVLYALVTGHHPIGFVEGLLGAPSTAGRPVPVHELRPDASPDIDELCLRTFAGTPPATAGEVAALLAERATPSNHPGGGPLVAVVGDGLPGTTAAADTPVTAALPDEAAFASRSAGAEPNAPQHIDLRPYDAGLAPSAPAGQPPHVVPGFSAFPDPRPPSVTASPDHFVEASVPARAAGAGGALATVRTGSRRAVVALRDSFATHADGARRRLGGGAPEDPSPRRRDRGGWGERYRSSSPLDDDWSILPLPTEVAEAPAELDPYAGPYDQVRWVPEIEPEPPVSDRRPPVPEPPAPVHEPVDLPNGGPPDAGRRSDPVPSPAAPPVPPRRAPARELRGASTRRPLVAAGVIAALVVAVSVGAVWGLSSVGPDQQAEPPATQAAPDPAPSAPPSAVTEPTPPAGPPATPVGVQPLDPEGDDEENDADAPRAIDGDPATAWRTAAYQTQNFGNLKSGVGLVVNLGEVVPTSGLTVTAPGDGGTFQVLAATQPVFDGATPLADGTTSTAGPVPLTWDPVETQYLIIWFTALPQNEGQWRGLISEVALS